MRLTTEIEVTLIQLVSELDTLFNMAKLFTLEPQLRDTEDGGYYERQYREAIDGMHPIRDALHELMQRDVKKGQYKKLLSYVRDLLFYQWRLDQAMRYYTHMKLYAKDKGDNIYVTWSHVNLRLLNDLAKLPIQEMAEAFA